MTGTSTTGATRPRIPAPQIIHYVDPIEGVRGYLAYAGRSHRLAAGGLRVQPGLGAHSLARLAETMELKERLLGLGVDGAKAGLDYDPHAPGKPDVLRRFLEFLRPHLLNRLSLGPDMGTRWPELEDFARQVGLVSVKGAVAQAQGLEEADFMARLRLLDEEVDGAALGERRAGHALAHAALAAVEAAGVSGRAVRIGIQGFGTLGRATAVALTEAGLTPSAVTDEHTCLHCSDDADDKGAVPVDVETPQRMFEIPLDVLVLAACEDALGYEQAARLDVSAVVVGANLGLSAPVEALLHRRAIVVVPDFVGGCGGSASMDVLFGAPTCPSPSEVLERLGARMRALVSEVLELSRERGIPPREAALAISDRPVSPGPPYGRWRERGSGYQPPPAVGQERP